MKAILTTPKFGGRAYLLGPYTKKEAEAKLKTLSTKYDDRKIIDLDN